MNKLKLNFKDLSTSYLISYLIYVIVMYRWFHFRDSIDYNELVNTLSNLNLSDIWLYVRSKLGYADVFFTLYLYIISSINSLFANLTIVNLPFVGFFNFLIAFFIRSNYFIKAPFIILSFLVSISFYPAIVSLELRRLGFGLMFFLLSLVITKYKLFLAFISFTIHPSIALMYPLILIDKFGNVPFNRYKFSISFKYKAANVILFLLFVVALFTFNQFLGSMFSTTIYKLYAYSAFNLGSTSNLSLLLSISCILIFITFFKINTFDYLALAQFSACLLVLGPSRINILLFFYFIFRKTIKSRLKALNYKFFVIILLFSSVLKSFIDLPIDPCSIHVGGGCGIIEKLI